MYVVIKQKQREDVDLDCIQGAPIIEWIDTETVAVEVDVIDLESEYSVERGVETSEFWGMTQNHNYVEIDLKKCTWQGLQVQNLDAVEEEIAKMEAEL